MKNFRKKLDFDFNGEVFGLGYTIGLTILAFDSLFISIYYLIKLII